MIEWIELLFQIGWLKCCFRMHLRVLCIGYLWIVEIELCYFEIRWCYSREKPYDAERHLLDNPQAHTNRLKCTVLHDKQVYTLIIFLHYPFRQTTLRNGICNKDLVIYTKPHPPKAWLEGNPKFWIGLIFFLAWSPTNGGKIWESNVANVHVSHYCVLRKYVCLYKLVWITVGTVSTSRVELKGPDSMKDFQNLSDWKGAHSLQTTTSQVTTIYSSSCLKP